MASVFIPTPTFPSVPMLPGVPQLARPIAAVGSLLPAIIAKLQVQQMPQFLFHATKAQPVWGVFDNLGGQLLNPDSIMVFGMRQEYRVSDYPVQDGQFASYDKVTVPREIMLRMVKGGTLQDRVQFEDACETVAATLDTVRIITPEKYYDMMNPFRHEVNRVEKKGAYFIECEMYFRLIRETVAQYSSTQAAASNTSNAGPLATSAIPPANLGLVQPVNPSPNLIQMIDSVIGPSPVPAINNPFGP